MPKAAVSKTKKKTGNAISIARFNRQQYSFKNSFGAWYLINQHLPNPDRVLNKKAQTIALYRELLSDAHLTASLDSRECSTLSFEWRLEQGNCPTRLYSVIQQWFYSIIERKMSITDLSRDEINSNLLDVIYWGYQPAELSWEFYKSLWLPINISPKPPEWFQFFIDEAGCPELRFMSKDNIDGERIPDPYLIICPRIKATFDNPYGRGVASRCFWPIVFKRAGLEFWLNFLERFGTPWVKGTITGGVQTDQDTLRAFADELKVMVQDAVIAVSGNREVELMETGSMARGGGNDGFKILCDFMDSQISKTILGHTLSTDAGDKSSYAATKSALTVRSDIQQRDVSLIRSIWQDIINLIFMRNGYYEVPRPKVIPFHETSIETERATRDEALTRAGVRFSKQYFMRAYHLEEGDVDEIVDTSKLQATGLKQQNEKDRSTVDVEDQARKIRNGGEK